MENKQTAVDSIIVKLNNVKPTEFCSIETIKEWCQQAKEMEKEQIKSALYNGYLYEGPMPENECFGEQYFNKKYGGNK